MTKTIFHYDNTIEGLFSCIFIIYDTKAEVENILSINEISIPFDMQLINVVTDLQQHQRIVAGIIKKIGKAGLSSIIKAYASCDNKKEMIIYNYLKLVFKHGSKTESMLSDADVITFNEMLGRVNFECHRFTGFVRFRQTTANIYIAPIRPDNDILEYIMPHFVNRFQIQKFAIVDVGRNKVGYFDGKNWNLGLFNNIRNIELTDDELIFQKLWKQYYETVTIQDRKSERRRKQFMPSRYWEFMNEFNIDKKSFVNKERN